MPISPLPARAARSTVLVEQARAALDELAAMPAWQLGDGELVASTQALYRLVTSANAEALRRLGEFDSRGLAPDAGSPTSAAWLTARLQMGIAPARKQVALAEALKARPVTAGALADGAVSVDNAVVVTSALDALPASVDEATIQAAEVTLVDEATRFTPKVLTRVAQGLHNALDPDGAEPQDCERPDPGYYLDLRLLTDGSCQGRFWLDPALGLQLAALIDAASAPRPSTNEGPDLRSAARRRHDALADLVHLALAHPDPVPGLGRPTLALTVDLDDLRAGLPGHGPDHTLIPAATVRRMACDAGIVPIVLGSRSEVLDIGRRSRTVPAGIRRALIARDQGCAFPGCRRPDSWTEAHHIRHWTNGGITALNNLVLLCGHHHDTVHHRGWTVRIDQHGLPEFTGPGWLRAAYHHTT
jgi:hypothetical protein